MEHRWYRREPLEAEIFLYQHGLPIAIGTTRDVSREGMFVTVHSELPRVSPGTTLEVGVTLQSGGVSCRYRIPAEVVHRREEGVGLLFSSVDHETLELVEALISQAREQPIPGAYAYRKAVGHF